MPDRRNTELREEVAGVTGLEPATSGVPARFARYLNNRNVTPDRKNTELREEVAGVTGLEPATSGVTGLRSNQLSYTPAGKEEVASYTKDFRNAIAECILFFCFVSRVVHICPTVNASHGTPCPVYK